MGQLNSQEREETLDKLIDDLAAHIPVEQMDSLREFVYRYYALDTSQDLLSRNWQDLLERPSHSGNLFSITIQVSRVLR